MFHFEDKNLQKAGDKQVIYLRYSAGYFEAKIVDHDAVIAIRKAEIDKVCRFFLGFQSNLQIS